MKKTQAYSTKTRPFPIRLKLLIVCDKTVAAKELGPLNDAEFTSDGPYCKIALDMTVPRTRNRLTGLVVHECTHCVDHIQNYVETTFDRETRAYLTQYLVEWCLDKIDDFDKKMEINR